MRGSLSRQPKTVSHFQMTSFYSPLLEDPLQLLMNSGAVRGRIIDHMNSRKIAKQFRRTTDMKGVTVGEQYTIEPVHSRPVQILPNHTFIRPLTPAVEQPICASR